MKKLLGAAFFLAFASLAHAEGPGVPGHPDARNDRRAEMMEAHPIARARHNMKRHAKRHHVVRRDRDGAR
jgi:hypothetical protein